MSKDGFTGNKGLEFISEDTDDVVFKIGPGEPFVGKTLRDEFAMAAMQGLLSNQAAVKGANKASEMLHQELNYFIAFESFKLADAMLKARGE